MKRKSDHQSRVLGSLVFDMNTQIFNQVLKVLEFGPQKRSQNIIQSAPNNLEHDTFTLTKPIDEVTPSLTTY